MVLSEVEILKSTRLARAVVVAEKLNENEAFLNPPRSPIDWLKARFDGADRHLCLGAARQGALPARIPRSRGRRRLLQSGARLPSGSGAASSSTCRSAPTIPSSPARSRAPMPMPISPTSSTPISTPPSAPPSGCRAGSRELRDSSQAAALEVEKFRAENGLTAARGELMSEQQLSDLNSQLIVAQADTANALARYTQYKSIIDSGPENAVKNATIPSDKANSSVINELKTRYLNITKREQEITTRFGEDHPQAVALRREQADVTRQIFQELQQLTESYRNEYEVAKSRETSLRGNVGEMTGQNSQSSQSMVQLRELEQKSTALATLYQTFLARYEEASQQRSFPIAKARVISRGRRSRRRHPARARRWCWRCRWCSA